MCLCEFACAHVFERVLFCLFFRGLCVRVCVCVSVRMIER